MRGGPAAGQGVHDQRRFDARGMAHRRAGERVVDRQLAEPGDARRHARRAPAAAGRQPQRKAHAVEPRGDDVFGAHVGVTTEAVAEHPRRGAVGHPAHAPVVLVEDRDAVRGQRLDELALRPLDRRQRAHPAQVHAVNRRDNADARLRQAGKVGDLTARVHAHLEHHRAVVGAEPQERQRQADLVVLVALGAQRSERRTEDGGDGLLGRGLGDAPRDAHHQRIEARPPAGGDRGQRDEPIRHAEHGHVAECVEDRLPDRSADDERGRAREGGVGQEAVAVGSLAGKGNEELAVAHEPGVDGGAANRSAAGAQEAPAGEPAQVVGGEGGSVGSRGLGAGARRLRPLDGHGPKCGTGPAPASRAGARLHPDHRSARTAGGSAGSTTGSSPGVLTPSVATRRNSSVETIGRISWPSGLRAG